MKWLVISAMIVGLLSSSASAGFMIDFEDASDGTLLNTRYPGVIFGGFTPSLENTGPGPNPLVSLPTTTFSVFGVTNFGTIIAVAGSSANSSDRGDYGILMTFDAPIISLSLIGKDGGGNSTLDDEDVTLTAFDASGAVLGSTFFNPPYAAPNLVPASIAFPNMKYVAFTFSDTLGFFGIDQIEYQPAPLNSVPEPSSLVLTGLGAIVFLGRRIGRCRDQSAVPA